MSKPNTMDDLELRNQLLNLAYIPPDASRESPLQLFDPNDILALITAKLQEVDRAARIEELETLIEQSRDTFKGQRINAKTGRVEVLENIIVHDWQIKDRLASLKGGDV